MLSRHKTYFHLLVHYLIFHNIIPMKTNDYSIQFNWQLKNVDRIKYIFAYLLIEKVCAISIRQTNTLTTFNIVVCFELGLHNDGKPCVVSNVL